MAWSEIGLLICELLVYAAGMLLLFRLRRRMGLGLFFTALGSLHFLETYLAANLYVQLMPGISLSPGSVILFSGKFFFVLLLYIREDALVARQPIYGLLFGNVLTAALVLVLSQHATVSAVAAVDARLLDQLGALMLWGSVLLFIDCVLVILLYERLSRSRWMPLELRLWVSATAILVFDQIGFFSVLHWFYGAPWSAGIGGLLGKIGAAACYSVIIALYLRHLEREDDDDDDAIARPIRDLFGVLTYRQRYEALRTEARTDALTGLAHRGRFDAVGERLLREARERGTALSALMIDIDHFKQLNDSVGHQAGDNALRHVADVLQASLRAADHAFRYGGDEFAVLLPDTSAESATALAERLRERIGAIGLGKGITLTASVGVATRPARSALGLEALLLDADRALYAAKDAGRNRVSRLRD